MGGDTHPDMGLPHTKSWVYFHLDAEPMCYVMCSKRKLALEVEMQQS